MPINLVCCNIEGDRHYDTLLPFLDTQSWDVLCLQEVFGADLINFETRYSCVSAFGANAIMAGTDRFGFNPKGKWGIAILVRDHVSVHFYPTEYYYGTSDSVPIFDEPKEINRAVLTAQVAKNGQSFTIATTHFTWTPDGETDDRQWRDLAALLPLLSRHRELIVCGDFNAPRGKEIFAALADRYRDNIPPEITSTLDPELHALKGKISLVIDGLFSTSGYQVSNVNVHQGISDHMPVTARLDLSGAAD